MTSNSYNSAVFYIGANNEYDLYAVHADSLSGLYITSQLFDRIEGTRWIQMYDNTLVSYGHVGLVIDEFRTEIENKTATGRPAKWPNIGILEAAAWNNGVASWNLTTRLKKELGTPEFIRNITATGSISKEWIRFDRLFRLSESPQEANNPPRYAHVSHAYAQRLDTASRIQLSLTFLVIVIVCNSVKLLTMLWVVFLERQDYIVTLGDGASTFLKSPDPKTERMCILSKPEVVCEVAEAPHAFKHDDQLERLVTQSGKRWRKQYSTYSNALNRDREVGSYFMQVEHFLVIFTFANGTQLHCSGRSVRTTHRDHYVLRPSVTKLGHKIRHNFSRIRPIVAADSAQCLDCQRSTTCSLVLLPCDQ